MPYDTPQLIAANAAKPVTSAAYCIAPAWLWLYHGVDIFVILEVRNTSIKSSFDAMSSCLPLLLEEVEGLVRVRSRPVLVVQRSSLPPQKHTVFWLAEESKTDYGIDRTCFGLGWALKLVLDADSSLHSQANAARKAPLREAPLQRMLLKCTAHTAYIYIYIHTHPLQASSTYATRVVIDDTINRWQARRRLPRNRAFCKLHKPSCASSTRILVY